MKGIWSSSKNTLKSSGPMQTLGVLWVHPDLLLVNGLKGLGTIQLTNSQKYDTGVDTGSLLWYAKRVLTSVLLLNIDFRQVFGQHKH